MIEIGAAYEHSSPNVVKRDANKGTDRPRTVPIVHLDALEENLTSAINVYDALGNGNMMDEKTAAMEIRDNIQDAESHSIIVRADNFEKTWEFLSKLSRIEIGGELFTSASFGVAPSGKTGLRSCVSDAATRELFEMKGRWDALGLDGVFRSSTGKWHVASDGEYACESGKEATDEILTDINWLDFANDPNVCKYCRYTPDDVRVQRQLAGSAAMTDHITVKTLTERQ